MRKIADAFKDRKAFIPFITAGDPDLATTEALIKIAADAGAALIEIGIPFSDPIAEGPVIQEADIRALAAGTTVDGIFAMAARLRETIDIPMVLMGYANPFFHYGYDAFFKRCAEVGIDGAIIPDIPFEEKHEAADAAGQYGVAVLSMIAPTSEERIQKIAAEAQGFIYLVSSMGVTGMRSAITTDLGAMVSARRAHRHRLRHPHATAGGRNGGHCRRGDCGLGHCESCGRTRSKRRAGGRRLCQADGRRGLPGPR